MDAGRLADARLGATASLAVFRAVLAALARPGTVVRPSVGVPDSIPPTLLPALALADLDVTFTVLAWDDAVWTEVVATATGARPVEDLESADLVVALRPATPDELDRLRIGDAFAPERGARLVVGCGAFGSGETFAVSGPGACPPRAVLIDGLDPGLFDGLARRNTTFPAGIDTWIVAADGSMMAVPRSAEVYPVVSPPLATTGAT